MHKHTKSHDKNAVDQSLKKIIERAENLLSKPVTASNHALAWHMIRLAGIDDKINGLGQLFKIPKAELSSQ